MSVGWQRSWSATRELPPTARGDVLRAYVALTKPRIIELLLVTTVPTMVLAEGGIPSLALVGAVLVGGASPPAARTPSTSTSTATSTGDAPHPQSAAPRHAVAPGAALAFGLSSASSRSRG